MATDEQNIIKALKHNWEVVSIEQHAKGYWNMDDSSFNLKNLKTKETIKRDGTGELYLSIKNGQNVLLISGDRSYYEITELRDRTLKLTCYFQNESMDSGPIKIATFNLARK